MGNYVGGIYWESIENDKKIFKKLERIRKNHNLKRSYEEVGPGSIQYKIENDNYRPDKKKYSNYSIEIAGLSLLYRDAKIEIEKFYDCVRYHFNDEGIKFINIYHLPM